jgi:RHS repeat-associated protein
MTSAETYDANGNTLTSGGRNFAYDSENRLTSMNGGAVRIVYDGFGNRVAETAGGVTTKYLVEDDVNPTGLPQVFDEIVNGIVTRTYTYGLQRIDEDQVINNVWTPSFYGYDGGGSVRQLTSLAGTVTDTYNYDAFGNLLNSTGSTPNSYLYRGEQYDSDLALYYLRARYYNPQTGRFMSKDPEGGRATIPATLQKYLYAGGNPVNRIDPRGRSFTDYIFNLSNIALKSITPLSEFVYGQLEAAALPTLETIENYLAAMDSAFSSADAVADYLTAVDWARGLTNLGKVYVCVYLELQLGNLLDKLTTDGASNNLPSEVTDAFEGSCLGALPL